MNIIKDKITDLLRTNEIRKAIYILGNIVINKDFACEIILVSSHFEDIDKKELLQTEHQSE